MMKVGPEERRNRLGVRHHLLRPAGSLRSMIEGMIGLHSSDPVTPFLASWARLRHFEITDLEAGLYQRRELVRIVGMRRTMFVVPVALAATVHAACTRALAMGERTRLLRMIQQHGIGDSRWLDEVERKTLAALNSLRQATASELTAQVDELALRFSFGDGRKWAGTVGMPTRLLFLLASEGKVVRVRPLGTWRSSQYRWAPTSAWLGAPLEARSAEDARADLAQRWLWAFGPGTAVDIKWWTGWTVVQTRSALGAVGAVEVELDGQPGFVLPDDRDPSADPEPWVCLLPGLDPTIMGWKERGWFLGDHQILLFDANGNAGPTVWVDGRVVGGWAQRRTGEIAIRLLEDVGSEATESIHAEAARLETWLGEARLTQRFRTPLQRELTD